MLSWANIPFALNEILSNISAAVERLNLRKTKALVGMWWRESKQ
jgi:hypothetical protein